MFVTELLLADASCGGKALGLARLLRAGTLSVPDGFVVTNELFREAVGDVPIGDTGAIGHALAEAERHIAEFRVPEALAHEVERRAAALGPSLAVRSSATIEDGAAGAAAGVYSSRRAVPVAEVWDAIRAVWRSALTPLAAAYARQRGEAGSRGEIAIAVIVQRFVDGERFTVYTRPPGKPTGDELLVQRGEAVIRIPRPASEAELLAPGQPAGVIVAARHALRAEAVIGATDGADVELVQETARDAARAMIQTWTVQARPIVHPAATTLVPPPPIVLAPLRDGRTWTWDVTHNPDPLSVAQAELVERVATAGASPYALRVVAGFLYSTPREAPARPAIAHSPVAAGVQPRAIASHAELAARAAELEARIEQVLASTRPVWPEVLEGYIAFYRIWAGELGPLIAGARALAPPPEASGHRPSAVEATLLAAARGELDVAEVERRLGVLSPAWDVAVPTFAERPGLLRDAIERAGQSVRPADATDENRGNGVRPHFAADLAERDDAYFARAQWLVREALLARARELGIAANDVFWIPFADLVDGADPVTVARKAAAARTAAGRAARWQMPVVFPESSVGGEPLHGVGTGPRVSGRVVRFASLASAIAVGRGDVIVTRAVTPALAVLVAGCAAIVSETGGLLDHGAALARELGVSCVVGCRDAWSRLSDGMLVTVDGSAGTVTIDS